MLLANGPIAAALRPCREESVDFDNTENLYIEGDNLDVLKLLRETYLNRVKMIYIDPPYNTGKDFIYEDDFTEETGEFLRRDGQYDEQGNRLTPNLDSNGRFHTDWLNMIYPRLRVARDLLTDDGVIFISIDDNEVENLKKVCNEVFGEANFEATIIPIVNPGGRDYKQIAITNEYLLMYSKNSNLELNELSKDVNFTQSDSLGGFEYRELRNRNPKFHSGNRPNLFYAFYVNPNISTADGYCAVSLDKSDEYSVEVRPYNSQGAESVWRWGKLKANENIKLGDLDNSQILAKMKSDGRWNVYEKARITTQKAKSIWAETEMRTENGTREIRALFGSTYFDHPKPLALLKRCVYLATKNDSIILDFFSGSATTAHAVMQLNAEDGGKRKFIMVQLPEVCPEGSEASKAGYKTICEIGKERIRRAGKKIKEENKDKSGIENLDIGFRVLKLDSSNMKDVYYTPEEYAQMNFNLEGFMDNIKPDRTEEDLLFQVMLDLGIPLSAKIRQDGETFYVNDNYLIACFGRVDTDLITEIAKKKPYYAVFRDSSFINDSAMVNFEQVFSTYSPNTIRRVL